MPMLAVTRADVGCDPCRCWNRPRAKDWVQLVRQGKLHEAKRLGQKMDAAPGAHNSPFRPCIETQVNTVELANWVNQMDRAVQEALKDQRQARTSAWKHWVSEHLQGGKGPLFRFAKQEAQPPIMAVYSGDTWIVHPDAVAAEYARSWGEIWQVEEPTPEPNPEASLWAPCQTAELPALTGEHLRMTLDRIPSAKASGPDGWSVRELKSLQQGLLDMLAEVFAVCERQGEWPKNCLYLYVVFLTKKAGMGPLHQRPIALLSVLYRVWARTRCWQLREHLNSILPGCFYGGRRG